MKSQPDTVINVDLFKVLNSRSPGIQRSPGSAMVYIGKVVERFNTEIIGKELFN